MAWQTPKTDWAERYAEDGTYAGDYFNASDYQRIKGNLEHLKSMVDSLYTNTGTLPEIPDVTVASFGYASTINALERSLDTLVSVSFDPGIPDTKTWVPNAAGPRSADLNRIESSCLSLYRMLISQAAGQPKLSFELGGSDF